VLHMHALQEDCALRSVALLRGGVLAFTTPS
jgi:hypothetical protein